MNIRSIVSLLVIIFGSILVLISLVTTLPPLIFGALGLVVILFGVFVSKGLFKGFVNAISAVIILLGVLIPLIGMLTPINFLLCILVGVNCRYNGSSKTVEALVKLVEDGKAIILCPEILANLPIPRESCEIIKNEDGQMRVLSEKGEDFTQQFVDAANRTLEICKIAGVKKAILQSRSPSCGFGQVYDGTFSGKLISGNGLTADLLVKNGVEVFDETNWR